MNVSTDRLRPLLDENANEQKRNMLKQKWFRSVLLFSMVSKRCDNTQGVKGVQGHTEYRMASYNHDLTRRTLPWDHELSHYLL